MAYNVDYSKIINPIEKHNKAIADIKDYLGEARFNALTKTIREKYPDISLEGFRLSVSFTGVQGYPAAAWYNYCFPL